ncbi:hypothetical protein SPRG_16948 [Saprolegnia parasitica CBS 223.65]|uniref:Uncharacterized protein n=1 Tax=Saprolegnia parasitica (strain CBS 223.65) TaxID=695850 RepID=A0A067BGZ3_SAPPC|nr:hypothetical protein SPRG_16948 [Saprolegnia parasitica CBS 223.65]KDO17659.1 hypothetical protein SPRG_16948 [Saprolegnia parasitica CBS 223.65]|eukprot:XP_012211635.1 hypothetical protein SPRG_16948 [Saprolegnia parasitica CBS 223.65]
MATIDAVFFRTTCAKPDVFNRAYVRCHQNQGLKVIRCFPHCDPSCCQHTYYRGCGTSVSVRVLSPLEATTTVAYARFQTASAPMFAAGDTVQRAELEADLRSRANLTGTWLKGAPEIMDDNQLCFHFNEKRSEGWHYDWHGGSSTKKRSELHHLVVYLFRIDEAGALVVLRVLTSPPFTLSSYRRAKSQTKTNGPALAVRGRATAPPPPFSSTPLPVELVVLPQSSTQESALRLLRLFTFCDAITIDVLADGWEVTEASIVSQLHERIHGHLRGPSPPIVPLVGVRAPLHPPPSALVTVALHVIAWWFHPSTLSWVEAFCARHHAAVVDNVALHEVYNKAVDTLAATIDSLLSNLDESLASLAEQLPPAPSTSSHAVGYTTLVKVMRESYMTQGFQAPRLTSHGYNGVWVWHEATPDVRRWAPAAPPRLVDVHKVLSMVYGLGLCVDDRGLHVRSHVTLWPAVWTRFELDQRPRVFQAFPNGESTLLDETSTLHGDYVAWSSRTAATSTDEDDDELHLHLYSWPGTASASAYCYIIRLDLRLHSPDRLDVCVVVDVVPAPSIDFFGSTADVRIECLERMPRSRVLLHANVVYIRHRVDDA